VRPATRVALVTALVLSVVYLVLVAAADVVVLPHLDPQARRALIVLEAVTTPFLVIAVYVVALVIGRQASAPIELARRRQLEFTADASHELRTPLSVIEAELGLAASSPRSAQYYDELIARLQAETTRLRRIVEDLLWLARFDATPNPPAEEPVDVNELAGASVERFRAPATARGIAVTFVPAASSPALIDAAPDWIDKLIGVLVDNAIRYTPSGGTAQVSVQASGGRVSLAVDDDGPGLPTHDRERLFDRFLRMSDERGGAGLGLAIADSIARSTSGTWTLGSSPVGGAHLEVSWPRVPAGAP
jgi:signal transduction histidine kinase